MQLVFTNVQFHSYNSRHKTIFERAVTALVQKKTTGISNTAFCTAFVVGEQLELGRVLYEPPRTIRLVVKSLNEFMFICIQENVHTIPQGNTFSSVA